MKRHGNQSREHHVTCFQILSVAGKAALVQLTPSTGVKHQIRVHLAFGLNTPILGARASRFRIRIGSVESLKFVFGLCHGVHVRDSLVWAVGSVLVWE